jgi:L-rhamnose mutarotase
MIKFAKHFLDITKSNKIRMAKLNPKDFSLVVARDIKRMLTISRRWKADYSDVIQLVESDQLFYFNDINHPNFYFYVGAPDTKSNGKPTKFPFNYIPVNSDSKNSTYGELELENIIKHFNIWLELITEFNSVNFDEDEDFLKIYEDEIFAEFEIIDADADVKPFDNIQQIILYTFLQTTITHLEKEYPDNTVINEIIEEANNLKNEIPILSKRVASKRFSKVLAKIQKFNPITFKDVYDVAKKEVIKYLLLKSVETVPQLVTSINHLLGML